MRNLLSINEFSKLSGVQSSTLRYWDEIGLFSPLKRDSESNYRYYSPEQSIIVNFITVLSSLHVPLKTISELGGGRTPENIINIIEHQEKLLAIELRRLQECFSIMQTRRELLNHSLKVMDGFYATDSGMRTDHVKIAVMQHEELTFVCGNKNEFDENGDFYEAFTKFCADAKRQRINLSFPIGGFHENMDGFRKAPGAPDCFISIDPTGDNHREAGTYLTGYKRGYYGQFGDLPAKMAAYAKKNALQCSGPVYTVYVQDEVCSNDPSQYLVQATVAVLPL